MAHSELTKRKIAMGVVRAALVKKHGCTKEDAQELVEIYGHWIELKSRTNKAPSFIDFTDGLSK